MAVGATSAKDGEAGLVGRRVLLRPVVPSDHEHLYRLELSSALGVRWRQGGTTPSFDSFVQGLHAGVLAQYLVVGREPSRVLGVVSAYNPNLRQRFAYLAVAKFDPGDRSGLVLQGAALFVQHLFDHWDLRKLYLETPGYNLDAFGSEVGRLLREEGRLREHEYAMGRWWDLVVLALWRQDWQRWSSLILRYVIGGVRFRQAGPVIEPTRRWPEIDSGSDRAFVDHRSATVAARGAGNGDG